MHATTAVADFVAKSRWEDCPDAAVAAARRAILDCLGVMLAGASEPPAAILQSDEFQNATPYNKAFYETMFKVRDFWALPEYAELLDEAQQGFYDYVVNGNGTAQEALDKLIADWTVVFADDGKIN